jgi:hypothetical protein
VGGSKMSRRGVGSYTFPLGDGPRGQCYIVDIRYSPHSAWHILNTKSMLLGESMDSERDSRGSIQDSSEGNSHLFELHYPLP